MADITRRYGLFCGLRRPLLQGVIIHFDFLLIISALLESADFAPVMGLLKDKNFFQNLKKQKNFILYKV